MPRRSGPVVTPTSVNAGFMTELLRAARIIVAFIAIIWLIGAVDMLALGGHLRTFGIVPRTERGLLGILFAPFLHEGFDHLLGNTGPLFIFGGLVILRDERDFWAVTLIGALASGAGTWLFGRSAIHIGASGVIFAYFGYLILAGVFERRIGSLILSIVVFLVWWRTLFGLLPQGGISFEGHIFGLLGGALTAWLLSRSRRGRAAD